MKKILFLLVILLIPLVCAETSFFDNPDDMFIYSNPSASQAPSGGGGCRYEWNCTSWSECLPSEKQIRNCTNIGTCSDRYKPPEIEQNCTYTAPEPKKESKELEKENETKEEEEKETEEQEEIGEIIKERIVDKDKIFIFSIIILIALSIIFYLKKDYFKKLIKN